MTNRELDEAVAVQLGWTHNSSGDLVGPNGEWVPRKWSTDPGLSLGLMMGLPAEIDWFIDHHDGEIAICGYGELLASGPKSECARVFCEAFLKAKGIQ